MPRFHFNAHKGDHVIADLEGEFLPGIDVVRVEAIALAREMFADALKSSHEPPEYIQVTDSDGAVVLTVQLSDLIPKSMQK